MADSAAGVRVFSDDGKCVSDAVLMRRALEYVKAFDGVVAQHAQEPRLTEGAQMHEGDVSGVLGLPGWPAVAEEAIIARDVLLAEHVGSRLHVCHVSTAGSVEIIRWAKARGIDVTAEVTPHHLLLTDDLVRGYDPVFKVNPPLRTAGGRRGGARGARRRHDRHRRHRPRAAPARGQGLRVGRRRVRHDRPRDGALRGAGDDGRHRPARLGRRRARMSATPAQIGRVAGQGRPLAVGEPANLTLVDPAARRVVDPAEMATTGRNSPFRGRTLPGRVVATFYAAGRRSSTGGSPGNRRGWAHEPGRPAGRPAGRPRPRGRPDLARPRLRRRAATTFGEIVFSTGMTGYQETLTDPSYHRQVVVMTAPHIGNTGVNDEDAESRRIWVAGYVVRDPARRASNWRPGASSPTSSSAQGIVGISDVDTRALTRHLRERGAMRVGIFSGAAPGGPAARGDARRGPRDAADGRRRPRRRGDDRPSRTSSRRSGSGGSRWRRSTSASRR